MVVGLLGEVQMRLLSVYLDDGDPLVHIGTDSLVVGLPVSLLLFGLGLPGSHLLGPL